MLFMFNSVMYC